MRIIILLLLFLLSMCTAWTSPNGWTRREAIGNAAVAAAFLSTPASPSQAAVVSEKKVGISNTELANIIARDIKDNQFMVRADLTRSVYDESATFTDEIDTYQLDAWIQGTKRLFVADKSMVELVPNSLKVTDQEATFLFTEYLTFNIPFLLPKVYLSGTVILKRDPSTGLITSYKEKWDQDVNTVLLSAKLGGK